MLSSVHYLCQYEEYLNHNLTHKYSLLKKKEYLAQYEEYLRLFITLSTYILNPCNSVFYID